MTKILQACFLAMMTLALHGFEIDGTWRIVCAKNASPTERQAARELATFHEKVLGIKFKTVQIPLADGKNMTVKAGNYDMEEWHIAKGKDGLLFSGGLPNGVLYGVYEYIEQALGCRFLAIDATYVPRLKKLTLPETYKLAGKPAFSGRNIYPGDVHKLPAFRIFNARRKQNWLYHGPAYGWYDRSVANMNCHTYHIYAKSFPDGHPEYFSMDKNGKRHRPVTGIGPGQLCLSHPEVRTLVVKEMCRIIERDRATLRKSYPGMPMPMLIDVSANDTPVMCLCPGCKALQQKYGGKYSGVLLDFINDIAQRIEQHYPGMMVQTFAYEYTEEPPTGIKPRHNVLIQLAQLGAEFSCSGSLRDSLRSLEHPNNRKALQLITGWKKMDGHLKIWDYWRLYGQLHGLPHTNISAIAPNIRIYADNNVSKIFSEDELYSSGSYNGVNFCELGYWLGAQLMVNPKLDPKPMIREFMELYYGPAAPAMAKLLDWIEQSMLKENRNFGVAGVTAAYLTKEFYLQAEKLLQEAEQAAGKDQNILGRIGQERLNFDISIFHLGKRLGIDFDKAKLIGRYQKNMEWVMRRYYPNEELPGKLTKLRKVCEMMKMEMPLPEQFAGKNAYDFPWYKLIKNWSTEWASDPTAAGGKAIRLTGITKTQKTVRPGFHAKELEFGIYDSKNKIFMKNTTVPRAQMATDEAYHWYHLGRLALHEKNLLWVHWSWWMSLSCADAVYNPLSPDTEYDVWLSLKLTGPSYAPGSKQQDAVYLDRVIFVR